MRQAQRRVTCPAADTTVIFIFTKLHLNPDDLTLPCEYLPCR